MGVYTHTDGNWLTRRGSFLIMLVVFHVVLLWAVASGFATKFVEQITQPIKAEIINEVKPEEPPPPPPPVKAVEMPPVSVPPVLVDIQVPVDPPPIQIAVAPPTPQAVSPPVVYGPPAGPAGPPSSVVVKYAVTFKPDTGDYYPPTSITLQEEGKPVVKICWDNKGKVTEVTLAESSGKKRLDEAAVKFGKALKFRAGSVDGTPQGDCATQRVTFSLKDVK